MKKRFCVILFVLVALLLSGCSSESMAEWRKYVNDTVEGRLPTEDLKPIVSKFNLSYDDETLVEGERAFYIPNGFSEECSLENFTLLDLLNNGTVVYAFIGVCSNNIAAPPLNMAMPYETGSRSSEGGTKVLIVMACNPFDKVYAVYHLERVNDTTSFTVHKQVNGGLTTYVLYHDAKVETYPVERVRVLPEMAVSKGFSFDCSMDALAHVVELPPSFSVDSVQIQVQDAYCLGVSDLYVEFYVDQDETGDSYHAATAGEVNTVGTDENLNDWSEQTPEPVNLPTWEKDLDEGDISEDDVPDTFRLHYTTASLSYSLPRLDDWSYHDGDQYLELMDVELVFASGKKVESSGYFFRESSAGSGIDHLEVVAKVDDMGEDDVWLKAYFPVIGWEEREIPRGSAFVSFGEVTLQLPIIGRGVAYTMVPMEDGKEMLALSGSQLSCYATDAESCKFYRDVESSKVALTIPDGGVFNTYQLSCGGTTGVIFVSNDALYVCPLPFDEKRYCTIAQDRSMLTVSPVSYRAYSFCSVGTNALLIASFDDGVVRCDLRSGKRRCLFDWPCYAISQATGGHYWAIGFQTTDKDIVNTENFADARLYEIDLDENNSAVLTLQKKLQEDPSLWRMLSTDADIRTLWSTYCSSESDYTLVNNELQKAVSAYKDYVSSREELCRYIDELQLLSGEELTTLDKALFACGNWGALDNLIRTIYEKGTVVDPDASYDKLIERVELGESTEAPAEDEKEVWSPERKERNRSYYNFKRSVAVARVGKEKVDENGFAVLKAYDDWLKEFDSRIAAFQAALGQERSTVD